MNKMVKEVMLERFWEEWSFSWVLIGVASLFLRILFTY